MNIIFVICIIGLIIILCIIILVTNLAYKKGFNDGTRVTAGHNLDMLQTRYCNKMK